MLYIDKENGAKKKVLKLFKPFDRLSLRSGGADEALNNFVV